jgi:hypothetical protein
MNKTFNITRLSGAIALALGFAAPAGAVVVVGGDNGWEISFDGNVNAFYTHIDADAGYFGTPAGGEDESRVTSGFLPAFFSFTAKSPTVNGLTGSARFSFAPTINDNGATRLKTNAYAGGGLQGSTIDTREVLANIDGNFGTVSYGRTLSIFGRQAILSDMTLFGVGFTFPNNAGVTAGRIGHGYVYPDFQTRFSYKTPSMNGFQAEVGMFDPAEDIDSVNALVFNETDTPRFEGELSYATAFSGGTFKGWVDGQWQELSATGVNPQEADVYGVGVGANATFGGFGLTGYYYTGEGLGQLFSFSGAGVGCNAAGTVCEEADNDGFYVQGTYTFNGVTKIGASYGESNQDTYGAAIGAGQVDDASNKMYTVGIYHDVTSWLKVIGEYSHLEQEQFGGLDPEADVFSVGSFVTW